LLSPATILNHVTVVHPTQADHYPQCSSPGPAMNLNPEMVAKGLFMILER
jgi:hypothetical protein